MSQADVKNRSNNGEAMSDKPKPAQSGMPQSEAARRGDNRTEQSGPAGPGGAGETSGDALGGAQHPGSQARDEASDVRAESDPAPAEESLEQQLETARAELAEQKDSYLRAVAEAENIRRRAENEVANARKYAIEGFASEVLAVRDSLEIARSLEIRDDDTGAVAKMKEGLDLTLKQLDSALSKFAIETVDPRKGDKLDPERHQAMTTQESDNVPPNHILAVIQKGYTIHDRLLRPAMVVVAKKPQNQTQPEGETA
jgi:molecular chaperone GrpE